MGVIEMEAVVLEAPDILAVLQATRELLLVRRATPEDNPNTQALQITLEGVEEVKVPRVQTEVHRSLGLEVTEVTEQRGWMVLHTPVGAEVELITAMPSAVQEQARLEEQAGEETGLLGTTTTILGLLEPLILEAEAEE
jgi:hypothetical protein